MIHHAQAHAAPAPRRTNAVLSVIIVLLVLALSREAPGDRQAFAQSATPSGGMLNPADQRNQMIAELRRLNDAVTRLEQAMNKPVQVEVVRMPDSHNAR